MIVPTKASSGNWITPIRLVLVVLLILLMVILAYIFMRIWQRRRPAPIEAVSAPAAVAPDLTDENVKADDLSTHRKSQTDRGSMGTKHGLI